MKLTPHLLARIEAAKLKGWRFVTGRDGTLLKVVNPQGAEFSGDVDLFAFACVPEIPEKPNDLFS
jgi:hypothetical protein